jgi:hypothetical protein
MCLYRSINNMDIIRVKMLEELQEMKKRFEKKKIVSKSDRMYCLHNSNWNCHQCNEFHDNFCESGLYDYRINYLIRLIRSLKGFKNPKNFNDFWAEKTKFESGSMLCLHFNDYDCKECERFDDSKERVYQCLSGGFCSLNSELIEIVRILKGFKISDQNECKMRKM